MRGKLSSCYHIPAYSFCAEGTVLGGRNETLGAPSLPSPAPDDEQESISTRKGSVGICAGYKGIALGRWSCWQ